MRNLLGIQEAIARGKEIKGWKRIKKLDFIRTIDPNINFLEELFSVSRLRAGSE
ncbi:MAG: hypothetical protein WBB27_04460 [Maribacter sp.]